MGAWLSDGWAGLREAVCPSCVSETIKCRKLILDRRLLWAVQHHRVTLV